MSSPGAKSLCTSKCRLETPTHCGSSYDKFNGGAEGAIPLLKRSLFIKTMPIHCLKEDAAPFLCGQKVSVTSDDWQSIFHQVIKVKISKTIDTILTARA